MEKEFRKDGAVWNLDMEHVFTTTNFWLDEFANAPRYISLGFSDQKEYLDRKRELEKGFPGFVWHRGERVGREYRVGFSADTKENAYKWYFENYMPLFRKQAVEFFKEHRYLPYNFKNAFCHFETGQDIMFHGKIPGWCESFKFEDEVKCNDVLWVNKADNMSGKLSLRDKDFLKYHMDSHSFFDYETFIKEYIENPNPDFHKTPECIKKVYGEPNLAVAVYCNKESIIKELYKERPDSLNTDLFQGQPSLFVAVKKGNYVLTKFLLEQGANLEHEGHHVLNLAIYHNRNELCKLLLEHGADPNNSSNNFGSPLRCAVLKGNKEIVRELLEHGADPNSGGFIMESPMLALIKSNHNNRFDIGELLIKFGAINSDSETTRNFIETFEKPEFQQKWKDLFENTPLHKKSLDEKINGVKTSCADKIVKEETKER